MIAAMNNQTPIDEAAPACAWPNCSQPARVSVDATSIDVVCDRVVSRYCETMTVCIAHLAAYRDAIPKPTVPVAIPLDMVDFDFADLAHDCGVRSTDDVIEELRRWQPALDRVLEPVAPRHERRTDQADVLFGDTRTNS